MYCIFLEPLKFQALLLLQNLKLGLKYKRILTF